MFLPRRKCCSQVQGTSQLVIQSTRQLSEHRTKPPVVIFYLHACQVATPRNSTQNGRRNYGKGAYNKTYIRSAVQFGLIGYLTLMSLAMTRIDNETYMYNMASYCSVCNIEVTDYGEALECEEC